MSVRASTRRIQSNPIQSRGTLEADRSPRLPTRIPAELQQYSTWVYAAVVVIPVVNIALALLPLVRPRDDLSDIPLTPAQRRLLGLPPSSRPATPDSAYSTPPRYSRTPSLAGSPSAAAAAAAGGSNSIRSYASSPLSNVATPGGTTAPYSPSPSKLSLPSQHSPSSSAVSPLLHKAVGGSGALARAPLPPPSSSSFGSPGSPLGASTSSSLFGASTSSLFGASTSSSVFGDGPPTPTPVGGKRSSVSLNSKWLYERGRRASSSNWLHQNR